MPRTSVSISDDLRRRMDAVASEGVNWSAVAVQAFESKLAEIVKQRGARDMKEVVARLRASRTKTSDKLKAAGRAAGAKWAKNTAEAVDLERLATMVEDADWNRIIEADPNDAYGPGEHFVFALRPDDHGDRQAAAHFFCGLAHDTEVNDPYFIEGFVDGALEVWEAVQADL
jgi:hypothetical protein